MIDIDLPKDWLSENLPIDPYRRLFQGSYICMHYCPVKHSETPFYPHIYQTQNEVFLIGEYGYSNTMNIPNRCLLAGPFDSFEAAMLAYKVAQYAYIPTT